MYSRIARRIKQHRIKEDVVTALIEKGAEVTTNDDWKNITTAISTIQTGSGTSEIEVTKLNVVGSIDTPYIKTVTLNNPLVDYKLLSQLREFIAGADVTNLICGFNNADTTSFDNTNGQVVFDGTMHLASGNTLDNMLDGGVLGVGELWTYDIDKTLYQNIDTVSVVDGTIPQVQINGTKPPYVVKASNDIDLTNILSLNQIAFNASSINGGKMLLAVSVDSGVTYKVYDSVALSWVNVDINNLADFASKGMTKTVTDALTGTELEVLRNGSTKLRFAYYLSVLDSTSTASTDSISIVVGMQGAYQFANNDDFDVVVQPDLRNIDFKIYKNGTFTINVANN